MIGLYDEDGVRYRIDSARFDPVRNRLVRIWSWEHLAYWGPDRAGYATIASTAGVYEFEEAYAAVSHVGPEKRIAFEALDAREPGPFRAEPCGCGQTTCTDWHVWPVAAVRGVRFSKDEAEFVAALLTLDRLNPEANVLSTEFLENTLKTMDLRCPASPGHPKSGPRYRADRS